MTQRGIRLRQVISTSFTIDCRPTADGMRRVNTVMCGSLVRLVAVIGGLIQEGNGCVRIVDGFGCRTSHLVGLVIIMDGGHCCGIAGGCGCLVTNGRQLG